MSRVRLATTLGVTILLVLGCSGGPPPSATPRKVTPGDANACAHYKTIAALVVQASTLAQAIAASDIPLLNAQAEPFFSAANAEASALTASMQDPGVLGRLSNTSLQLTFLAAEIQIALLDPSNPTYALEVSTDRAKVSAAWDLSMTTLKASGLDCP